MEESTGEAPDTVQIHEPKSPTHVPLMDEKHSDGDDAPFLIAFVNFNSGGKMGKLIARALQEEIGKERVFNLSEGGPAAGLKKFPEKKDLRVLVAGGDGTVNWVLSTIDNLKMNPQPAVGIVPLGTGNDCALYFGWGHKFPGLHGVRQMAREMEKKDCPISMYDRWVGQIVPKEKKTETQLKLMPASIKKKEIPISEKDLESPIEEKKSEIEIKKHEVVVEETFEFNFNNYFSFGIDAQISNGFHHHRETYRACYCCRCCNLSCYGCFGLVSWLCCLGRRLPLEVEIKRTSGSDWEKLELPRDVRGIVLLNLPTYAGGRHIWGRTNTERSKGDFILPAVDDQLLEILGVQSTFHLGRMVTECSTGMRLAQANQVRVLTRVPSFVQLDGEPWEETSCRMEIRPLQQARMLHRTTEPAGCCGCCKS